MVMKSTTIRGPESHGGAQHRPAHPLLNPGLHQLPGRVLRRLRDRNSGRVDDPRVDWHGPPPDPNHAPGGPEQAPRPSPSHWVRFLKDWLSQRESKVRLNRALSRPRLFSAGVSQGSPLSPLLFVLSTASLPEAIRSVSPDYAVTLYADDATPRSLPRCWPTRGEKAASPRRHGNRGFDQHIIVFLKTHPFLYMRSLTAPLILQVWQVMFSKV